MRSAQLEEELPPPCTTRPAAVPGRCSKADGYIARVPGDAELQTRIELLELRLAALAPIGAATWSTSLFIGCPYSFGCGRLDSRAAGSLMLALAVARHVLPSPLYPLTTTCRCPSGLTARTDPS